MAVHRILLIDDDKDDYEIFSEIVHEINADSKVLYVQDASDIDNFLIAPLPEIIIIDFKTIIFHYLKFSKQTSRVIKIKTGFLAKQII